MNSHVHGFYRKFADEQAPIRLYHDVIPLHEASQLSWEELFKKAPALPRGWYELCRLPVEDRIAFIYEFWLTSLPFVPHIHAFLEDFFSRLDDIGVFLTQQQQDDLYACELVYSLQDESCFYHGAPPCPERAIEQIQQDFDSALPADYLAFLRIHDGFSKHSDTGMIDSRHLRGVYEQLMREIQREDREILVRGRPLDSKGLIPFYESFGKSSYQCFYTGWTPMDQAGNIYFSIPEKSVSDFMDRECLQEKLAFNTFLDWLIVYLESVKP